MPYWPSRSGYGRCDGVPSFVRAKKVVVLFSPASSTVMYSALNRTSVKVCKLASTSFTVIYVVVLSAGISNLAPVQLHSIHFWRISQGFDALRMADPPSNMRGCGWKRTEAIRKNVSYIESRGNCWFLASSVLLLVNVWVSPARSMRRAVMLNVSLNWFKS